MGVEVFFVIIFFLQKAKNLLGIHLNTWKYNVCCIKLETKVLRLHRIQSRRFHWGFFLNKYAVHEF